MIGNNSDTSRQAEQIYFDTYEPIYTSLFLYCGRERSNKYERGAIHCIGLENTCFVLLNFLFVIIVLFQEPLTLPHQCLFDVKLVEIQQQVTITDQEMKAIVMVTGTVSGIPGEALLVMKTVSVESPGCDFLR